MYNRPEQLAPPNPTQELEQSSEQTEHTSEPVDSAPTVTDANSFGVFREYPTISSHNPRNPDAFMDIRPPPAILRSIGSDLATISTAESAQSLLTGSENRSSDMILAWMATSPGNTPSGVNDLVHSVLRHPDFNTSELENFNATTVIRRFKRAHFSKSGTALKAGDGWKVGSVKIRVPCTKVRQKENEAPEFVVDGILYRDAIEVISGVLEDPDEFDNIHISPHKEWWRPRPGEDPVRVYSEMFNSDAMLQANEKTQANFNTADESIRNLETFVVSALLYSDSTHLASFGSASLWPVYLFLGNVSKYIRLKPTSLSAHHIAYIPTVCFLIC